ncbi:MAG: nucleotidyltransferase domain-containing protein [Ignavibacteriae bacterium]|nr:nucleotidyltransferase domain-containing protein [Ignavibacteriota bacterium]
MVKVPDSVMEKINLFLDELRKNNINVRQAILFGSYAKGNYNEWSDIDLAIVSDDFEGMRYNDMEKIRIYNAVTNWEIAPLPYNTENFDDEDLFVKEILESGINILKN